MRHGRLEQRCPLLPGPGLPLRCGPGGRHRLPAGRDQAGALCAACLQPGSVAPAGNRRRAGARRHAAAMVARRAGRGRLGPGAPPRGAAAAGRRHPRTRPAGGTSPAPARCAGSRPGRGAAGGPAGLCTGHGRNPGGAGGSEDTGTAWALVGWLRAAAYFGWTLPEEGGPRAICREALALLGTAEDSYGRALAALTRGYIRKLDRLDYDLSDSRAAEPLRLRGWRIAFGRG